LSLVGIYQLVGPHITDKGNLGIGVDKLDVKNLVYLLCPGLVTATVASEVYKAAQPALLYLVPFTLLPILVMAYLKVRVLQWNLDLTNLYTTKSSV